MGQVGGRGAGCRKAFKGNKVILWGGVGRREVWGEVWGVGRCRVWGGVGCGVEGVWK